MTAPFWKHDAIRLLHEQVKAVLDLPNELPEDGRVLTVTFQGSPSTPGSGDVEVRTTLRLPQHALPFPATVDRVVRRWLEGRPQWRLEVVELRYVLHLRACATYRVSLLPYLGNPRAYLVEATDGVRTLFCGVSSTPGNLFGLIAQATEKLLHEASL